MRAVGAAMSFDGMRRPSFSQANVQIAGASELMSAPNTLVVPVCALVPTPDGGHGMYVSGRRRWLHVGWAVEGAIGSKHKIDASYLSPHVNIAARLQAATKQFGVSMLLSGEFVDGLSSQLKRLCRPLDRVALKGSKEPMMLFSFEPRMDERKRYFDRFELGVEAYLNGEWEQARALLEGCVNSDPGDRPPAVLLEYMEERDFVAPPTWSGHRELTSK